MGRKEKGTQMRVWDGWRGEEKGSTRGGERGRRDTWSKREDYDGVLFRRREFD